MIRSAVHALISVRREDMHHLSRDQMAQVGLAIANYLGLDPTAFPRPQ